MNNSILSLDSSDNYAPLVFSKSEVQILPQEDYIAKFKFRYTRLDASGQGFGIGFFNKDGHNIQQAAIWQDVNDGLQVLYDKSFSSLTCDEISSGASWYGDIQVRRFPVTDSWHVFEVEKVGSSFNLYLDREQNTSPVFSFQQLCNPNRISLGNMQVGGAGTWNPLQIDYISIAASSEVETPELSPTPTIIPTSTPLPTPTPTLVPSPTPTPKKDKIIVIPGLGASWNTAAMVGNVDLPNDQWHILSFVHNYDGLMATLKREGYQDTGPNQDLWLWPYDWRERITDITGELNNFIQQNVGAEEKFDLIGHSLGGLVARIWSQNHSGDSRLQKVITLGSPHQGTIKAYEVWAGGEVPKDWGWKAVALNVLLEIQKERFLTTVNEIRSVAPVLQDINPTFTFLRKKGGEIGWQKTVGANKYLDIQNSSFNKEKLNTVTAEGLPTKRWIMAEEPSFIDKSLMKWADGKPISYLVEDGDGTVLSISASVSGVPNVEVAANHGGMVDASIPYVLDVLGLPKVEATTSPSSTMDNSLVYFIGSPAFIEVTCNDGVTHHSDIDGYVVISNNGFSECKVVVVGTGSGQYHLVAGSTNDYNSWRYYKGEISTGEKEEYLFGVSQSLVSQNKNRALTFNLIEQEIKNLGKAYPGNVWLKRALEMTKKKQVESLLEMVLRFRNNSHEYQISNQVIVYIAEILANDYQDSSQGLAKAVLNAAKVNKDRWGKQVGSRKVLSEFQISSLNLLSNYLDQMEVLFKAGRYGEIKADSIVMEKLVKEVW
ncbi:hypothetical protein M1116_00350 [Patescibacteria group bacterium]|nr:hypothetical protein [Patescibacteria group bacterium]